jgi:hypothetical protein
MELVMKLDNIFVVLLKVNMFDRKTVSEQLEGRDFVNKIALELEAKELSCNSIFNEDDIRIYSLSDFMDAFNDEELEQSEWWLSYVTIYNIKK